MDIEELLTRFRRAKEEEESSPSSTDKTAASRLYPWLGKTVGTPEGLGKLWQVFSTRVGVVLELDPERVNFFLPAQIRVNGEMRADAEGNDNHEEPPW